MEAATGKHSTKRVDGISMLPTLMGMKQPAREFMYREFAGYGGQQAIWWGDWKAIRQKLEPTKNNPNPAVKTELYNLKEDVAETHDVAALHPDITATLEAMMQQEHMPSKQFPMPILDALLR